MSVRTENAAKANAWFADIEKSKTFKKYIDKSIKKTEVKYGDQIYTGSTANYINEKLKDPEFERYIELTAETTGDALFSLDTVSHAVAVLNFASYFNPGGGFLKGSISQEESLCHISGLYNILSNLKIYEERASRKKTPPEYEDEIIYSPGVPFAQGYDVNGRIILADVITCAAPNCNRVPIAQQEAYKKAVVNRIYGIYTEPYLHGCNVLILGAWGCGVFKNDPTFVASIFKEMNDKFGQLYKKVIYAIPNEQIYKEFERVFGF